MTSNEAESTTAGEREKLFQPKNQKGQEDKPSALPKWFEDSRNMHEQQAKYLGKIYEMRENLMKDEKRLMENASTRADRQKFLSTRPLRGRPRAFTSPSLLDDVRGILISRRPDVRTHQPICASSDGGEESSRNPPAGARGRMITREGGSFYRKASDLPENMTSGVNDEEVFIKIARCTRGRACEGLSKCPFCHRDSQEHDSNLRKMGKKGFCTKKTEASNNSSITKQREPRKDTSSSTNKIGGSHKEKERKERRKNRKEPFSRLPKLKEIPRQRKYETKVNRGKSSARNSSISAGDVMAEGKHVPVDQLDKCEEFFAKLEMLDAQMSKGNSPTSISPRSISPFSLSDKSDNSPTSPTHNFKFPDPDPAQVPKVSINLPPVPMRSSYVTSSSDISISTSGFGLSRSLDDDAGAPVIVLRPATPYIERNEQPVKPQKKGWCLWKTVKQTEVRRVELRKLIEDIKEFNTSNKTIEQRLREVSTS